ncbi:hypothetical protein RBH29_17125 [Herbivorax sp. ANBcel31]|uniref:hypothetical protein n=1 Tax=Herbivorax sp. ANBcel31 TaxID=3069754 RepID=UPI0027B83ECC|nr:hypothetical protein [Herbivorax sp. ANBcel31]MDQ2088150.1 hypothetical protein [Herbivorax sp. ANBcel31]
MNFEENIKSYVKFDSNIPKKKGLLSFIWLILIICIPTGIFGAYASITKNIILPLLTIIVLWAIYLLINTEQKNQFILFLGVSSIFISISLLIATYKIVTIETEILLSHILIIMIIYVLLNITNTLNTLRLIKNGYFNVRKKSKNHLSIIFGAGLFGLVVGRILFTDLTQDTAVVVIAIIFIFLAFLFSTGTHNLLKYFFIKKYKIEL